MSVDYRAMTEPGTTSGPRASGGWVRLGLPRGVAFPTRDSGPDVAALAGQLRTGPARVSTVVVSADRGAFELERLDGASASLRGEEFATAVLDSLDVLHADVQVALTWPRTTQACALLDAELARFAHALKRTVWVPEPAGSAVVLPGVGELAAVDEIGSPAGWREYPPAPGDAASGRLHGDLDGRLVPPGEAAVTAFAGAPLVCVPPAQLEQLREWYESVAACPGLFAIDLAVLDDGRLGVCRGAAGGWEDRDGSGIMAIGGRQLRRLMTRAGWSGEDLLLLAQPAAALWDQMAAHARHLIESLAVDVWLAGPGAEVWVRPDGSLDAEGPDGSELAWRVLAYGRTGGAEVDIPMPAALSRGAAIRATPARPAVPAAAMPMGQLSMPFTAPAAARPPAATPPQGMPPSGMPAPPMGAPPPAAVVAGLPLAGPASLAPVPSGPPAPTKPDRPHGVVWLPLAPAVNARPIDLYLAPAVRDDEGAWGLPTADLFLLAGQDPLRLAEAVGAGTLVRVHAPAQSAVELQAHTQQVPEPVRRLDGRTHVLPLAWLGAMGVTAAYQVDGDGGIGGRRAITAGSLAARFEGADHGVTGLPATVVHWPDRRLRTDAPAYLLLREDLTGRTERLLIERGYLPLTRRRPELTDGHRLFEVRVRRRSAIDLPATLERLAGLAVVGGLREFADGDLLLTEREFQTAIVTRAWRWGRRRRVVVDRLDGATLDQALSAVGDQPRR